MPDEMDFTAHLPVKLLGDLVLSLDTAAAQAQACAQSPCLALARSSRRRARVSRQRHPHLPPPHGLPPAASSSHL